MRTADMGGVDRMKDILLCLGCFLLGAAVPIAALVWACWKKIKSEKRW